MDIIDYAEEPGPGIAEIHQLPAGEEIQDAEVIDAQAQPVEDGWLEQAVAEHLKMVGSALHMVFGEGETDFEISTKDEERIAPPLTRILNRYEPLRKAAEYSDPVLLGYGTTMYVYRSMLQRRDAILAKREQEDLDEQDFPVAPRAAAPHAAPDDESEIPVPGVSMEAASPRARAMQQAAALAKEQ